LFNQTYSPLQTSNPDSTRTVISAARAPAQLVRDEAAQALRQRLLGWPGRERAPQRGQQRRQCGRQQRCLWRALRVRLQQRDDLPHRAGALQREDAKKPQLCSSSAGAAGARFVYASSSAMTCPQAA
jgi:hypothetical protein